MKSNSAWLIFRKCNKEILLLSLVLAYIIFKEIYCFVQLIMDAALDEAYSILWVFNLCAIFYFFALYIISYEYFYIFKRDYMEEAVRSITGKKEEKKQLWLLLKIHMVLITFFIIFNVLLCVMLGKSESIFIYHLIENIFVNAGMIGILAILLGKCISIVSNKKLRVFLLIFFAVMFSGIVDVIDMLFAELFIDFYKVRNAFALLPKNINFMPNLYVGFPVQIQRVVLICIWLLICHFIVSLYFWKKKKLIHILLFGMEAVAIIISVAFLAFPYTDLTETRVTPNGYLLYAQDYYIQQGHGAYSLEEAADFCITEYKMELSFYNQLYANVTMHIDNSKQDNYKFTLYHNYKIKIIENQNEEALSFSREGDYMCIQAGKHQTESITILYEGTGCPFYSEWKGAYLKAGFPYYPIAGYCKVYEEGGYKDCMPKTDAEFYVKINTLLSVYSNLNKISHNEWQGNSQGVTLIGGMVREEVREGITFISPILWDSSTRTRQQIQLTERMKMLQADYAEKESTGKITVFYLPYFQEAMQEIAYKDQIFVIDYTMSEFEKNYREYLESKRQPKDDNSD